MAKQILISERPGENAMKQSIGNYKGVMLCNRPNDPAEKMQREGPAPFISRVTVKEALGINPSNKPILKQQVPKRSLEILKRHKLWLSQLQKQKDDQALKDQENLKAQEEKLKKMKKKFKPKNKSLTNKKAEAVDGKSDKLTEKNLKLLDSESKPKEKEKEKEKPKWALTEEQAEQAENEEADELLQFVHGLDYDAFIDDLEVRQALEIVKERIEEIKKDKEWKQHIAAKFNNEEDEKQSVRSGGSMKSFESKAKSQVDRNLAGDKKNEAEWDRSVRVM